MTATVIINGEPMKTETTTIESSNNPAVGSPNLQAGQGAVMMTAPLFSPFFITPSSSARLVSISPILLLLTLALPLYADNLDNLINAMIVVESGGNDAAIGDGGKAVGCLQIWPITIKDANRIIGYKKYTLADRYDRQKSKEICRLIMTHYEKTPEGMCRRWNGGGNWRKIESTIKYWKKIERNMR